MVLDSKELGKQIANSDENLDVDTKDLICPILLHCHDKGESESNIQLIKTECVNIFPNTLVLKEIPTEKGIEYNFKFVLLIGHLIHKGMVPCPIFYIHPSINLGEGKGLICEFLVTLNKFPALREFSIVLIHKDAKFIEHLRYIHPRNVYKIDNIKEGIDNLIHHLEGHIPYIKDKKFSQNLNIQNAPSDIGEKK